MACFGGPSYSEINIESKPFLQVTVNLPKNKKMIEIVDLNGEMYTNVAAASSCNLILIFLTLIKASKKMQRSPQELAQIEKNMKELEAQEKLIITQMIAKNAELEACKQENVSLARKIDLMQDLVRKILNIKQVA